jgi:hypothetical protein
MLGVLAPEAISYWPTANHGGTSGGNQGPGAVTEKHPALKMAFQM